MVELRAREREGAMVQSREDQLNLVKYLKELYNPTAEKMARVEVTRAHQAVKQEDQRKKDMLRLRLECEVRRKKQEHIFEEKQREEKLKLKRELIQLQKLVRSAKAS